MGTKPDRRKRQPTTEVIRQRRLATFLRQNEGVITSKDLATLGFGPAAITGLVTTHRLHRMYRGVYRDGTIPPSVETDCRGALAATPGEPLLGLESAAHRQGLLQFPPDRPQIVVPERKRIWRREGFDVHRFPGLAAADILVVKGLACSGPTATILHLANAVRSERQWRALRRAVRQGVKVDAAVAGRLREVIDDRAPFPGSALLRNMLNADLLGTPDFRSTLEEDFLDFCDARGIPRPQVNAIVEGCEVDAVWIKEKVIVELDSWDHHGDELSFEADRERSEFLMERGWPVSRITGRRMAREPDRIEMQLRKRLGLPIPTRLLI